MKRLLISGFVALALFAAVTTLGSHSPSSNNSATTTGMASSKNSRSVAAASTLPIEDFEDMSLVFSTPAKH